MSYEVDTSYGYPNYLEYEQRWGVYDDGKLIADCMHEEDALLILAALRIATAVNGTLREAKVVEHEPEAHD